MLEPRDRLIVRQVAYKGVIELISSGKQPYEASDVKLALDYIKNLVDYHEKIILNEI